MSQVFGHYNALAKDEKHGCFIRCLRVGQQSPNESRSLMSWSPEDKAIFPLTAIAPKPVSFGDWRPPSMRFRVQSRQASYNSVCVRRGPSAPRPPCRLHRLPCCVASILSPPPLSPHGAVGESGGGERMLLRALSHAARFDHRPRTRSRSVGVTLVRDDARTT